MAPATLRSLLVFSGLAVAMAVTPLTAVAEDVAPAPERQVTRDLVRRALLDDCVYTESAREGANKDKVVDMCQCASARAIRGLKDEDIATLAETKEVPDAWLAATRDALPACTRR